MPPSGGIFLVGCTVIVNAVKHPSDSERSVANLLILLRAGLRNVYEVASAGASQ